MGLELILLPIEISYPRPYPVQPCSLLTSLMSWMPRECYLGANRNQPSCTRCINPGQPEVFTVVCHIKDNQSPFRIHRDCTCLQSQAFFGVEQLHPTRPPLWPSDVIFSQPFRRANKVYSLSSLVTVATITCISCDLRKRACFYFFLVQSLVYVWVGGTIWKFVIDQVQL